MRRSYPVFSTLPMSVPERAFLGAKAALAMLGDNPAEAADQLFIRDVRGALGVHTRTPLAMYLQGRTGLVWLVTDDGCTCALQGATVTVPHTEASRIMHSRFQRGQVPNLEGEPTTGTAGPVSPEQMQRAWRESR